MAKYFLNIIAGTTTIMDEEGVDYADLTEARRDAEQGARDILSEQLRDGVLMDNHLIEIRDEAGALCDTVLFRDVYGSG